MQYVTKVPLNVFIRFGYVTDINVFCIVLRLLEIQNILCFALFCLMCFALFVIFNIKTTITFQLVEG